MFKIIFRSILNYCGLRAAPYFVRLERLLLLTAGASDDFTSIDILRYMPPREYFFIVTYVFATVNHLQVTQILRY